VERLPEVRDAVASALMTLGDGNWKMGEGVQVGKAGKTADVDEHTILEHYTCASFSDSASAATSDSLSTVDVVNTVTGSLLTLSRTHKRPAFGSIFLLNNIAYLRSRILTHPRTDIPSLLSKPTADVLHSSFRTAKAGYFDSNFSPLMQTLLEDKDKSKSAMKEKFTRFFDVLEEVAERHRLARVLQDDRESRETIKEEAVKLVVPSLQRFTQRTVGKEFSKSQSTSISV
jgi:exocyst complex component 7